MSVQTAKFLGDITKFITSNGDGQIKVRMILIRWPDQGPGIALDA